MEKETKKTTKTAKQAPKKSEKKSASVKEVKKQEAVKTAKKSKEEPKTKKETKKTVKEAIKTTKEVKKVVKEEPKVTKDVKEEPKVTKEEIKTEKKIVEEKKSKNNKNNTEIIKTVAVLGVLAILVGLTFVIGLTNKKDKLLYQTHVGIKETTVNEYLDIISKNDTSIIYIGRPGCGYCQMFQPILTEVLNEYKIGVEYVNIEAISSQEEWDSFINSNDYLSSGEWGTPTLLVYKNGEIINKNPGYVEKNTLIKFLTDSNLIKGE